MDKLKNILLEYIKDRRKAQVLIISCLILLLLVYVLFSNYGVVNNIKLQARHSELLEQISTEKHAHDSLHKRYHLLKHDTLYIEQVAREKYGLVKPSEKVFIINKDSTR